MITLKKTKRYKSTSFELSLIRNRMDEVKPYLYYGIGRQPYCPQPAPVYSYMCVFISFWILRSKRGSVWCGLDTDIGAPNLVTLPNTFPVHGRLVSLMFLGWALLTVRVTMCCPLGTFILFMNPFLVDWICSPVVCWNGYPTCIHTPGPGGALVVRELTICVCVWRPLWRCCVRCVIWCDNMDTRDLQ